MPEPNRAAPALALTTALSWLVIALMLAAIIYAGWIAIVNWNRIGV